MQFVRHDDLIEVQVNVTEQPITLPQIREALSEAGYSRCQIITNQISNLLADYEIIQADIRLNKLPSGQKISRRIAVRRNGELKISIAADQMSVTAEITAAWGGQPVSANDVVRVAQEQGVTFGFQKDQIIQLVAAASRAEPGVIQSAIIALGRPMKPGNDACFEPLVEGMTVRFNKPMAQQDDRIDLRDFGIIPSVHSGEAVVRRLPPTPGVDGVTVLGEVTKAIPGNPVEWQLGEGVEVSPFDPELLVATRDGLPRLMDAGASVDEVYAIQKVDLSTGHVLFKGSVIVNGDVTESMKVIAGGNVFIKGMVDGMLIEAGGDINIGGAVIGHHLEVAQDGEKYSTVIKAKGDIRCNLAQYARFECQGDLQVTKQLNHCTVSARSVLAGLPDKLTGKIIGGNYQLDLGLKAGMIGSPSESALVVDLNRLVMPIVEKQTALKDNIQAIKREMEEIRSMIEQMKAQDQTTAMVQQISMFMEDYEAQKAIALAMIADVKALEIERQQRLNETLVMVKQHIYAGVEFKIGHEVLPIKRDYGATKVTYTDGQIKLDPLV